MTPYPAGFPAESFTMVLEKLRGGDVAWKDLAHAAWNVQGYAMGQLLGGPVKGQVLTADHLSDEEIIRRVIDAGSTHEGYGLPLMPWARVIRIVISLIIQYLEG